MANKKVDAKALLKAGWIHVLVTFEVVGKPKEHVDKTLKEFIKGVKESEQIAVLEEHLHKAMKSDFKATNNDSDFFSAFAEVDMLVKNLETLTWLSVNYMPSSIEVIEPDTFSFKALDLQNWQNDVLSRLHNVDARMKQQADFLRNNLVALMHNVILLSLARGKKQLSELQKDTSLVSESLEPQLKKLIELKRIKHKDGVYSLP